MASIITATTTSGLTQSADNSGVLQLASGTGNLVTVPSVTGTAMVSGNMPAFSAYLSSNQTFTSGAWTKIPINTVEFDTASAYDNSTNYRFTPLVAGYYQVNLSVSGIGASGAAVYGSIYKNGSNFKESGFYAGTSTGIDDFNAVVTSVISMNGTTDYVEVFATQNSGSTLNSGVGSPAYVDNYFFGFLARKN